MTLQLIEARHFEHLDHHLRCSACVERFIPLDTSPYKLSVGSHIREEFSHEMLISP
jgi:hypothetical protein